MRERTGHLFDAYDDEAGAWLVVTTNGGLDREGSLVMGAGVAGAAKRKFPGIERKLGLLVAKHGNVPVAIRDLRVMTWPTKPAVHVLPSGASHPGWMCVTRVEHPSCLEGVGRLVAASAPKLLSLADLLEVKGTIFTPRPGCGHGGLEWSRVRPWMQERFDDRFVVVDPVR